MKVEVVGNIGMPYCEKVLSEKEDTKYVIECSSFQLEDIMKFKPKVAAILNFSPDHLDRYENYIDYINAKLNIAVNMKSEDILILNYEDQILRDLVLQKNMFNCKTVFFSSKRTLTEGFYLFDNAIFYKDKTKTIKLLSVDELQIIGKHNYENVMTAAAMTHAWGVSFREIVHVLRLFTAVEHRIEYVAEKNGIVYYNDSKGTNPDAAIKGIQAMDRPTVLIGGGYDKNSSYEEWIRAFDGKVRALVLVGQTKEKIADAARRSGFNNIVMADTFEEAFAQCVHLAQPGDAVLLSPACASWGMFPNYEVRGRVFKELVRNLPD